jgi:hypothetical protein
MAHSEDHGLRQTLDHGDIAFIKGKGSGGKNFEQSNNFALVLDGCRKNRSDAKLTASVYIHAGISFRVVATQCCASAHAFPGKARVNVQPRA